MVSIKDVVRSSVKVPEFDKHLKKARRHIGRNVVEITTKMKTIVRKPFMIKIKKVFILYVNGQQLVKVSKYLLKTRYLYKENYIKGKKSTVTQLQRRRILRISTKLFVNKVSEIKKKNQVK